jgi:hypothetical protein
VKAENVVGMMRDESWSHSGHGCGSDASRIERSSSKTPSQLLQ